ncbi:ferritin family protein [Pectinatus brassicae]|jgi:rubrerythrin|uniref:Rubrerythrin n=1 Tax=Pectinatus brassicae TaxID=862415 RepID=A0A840UI35_9FIRM|nr:ferritin family protein [Pectinatus brassicae]MBB5337401.1 rubrerythrin [Pectinatus brassicae]
MNLLGVLKGTELEKHVEQSLEAEIRAVGMYHALAYLAKRKGYTEVATTLENIASDEARHAGLYSILNGHVQDDIFTTLTHVAKLESGAVAKIQEFAQAVRGLGLDQAAQEINATGKDEERHGLLLQALVEQYGNA